MTFDFHPAARDEFHDAARWYEDGSIFAGDRFTQTMRLAVNAILADPTRYQPTGEGVRVYRLKKFPFRLYYTFDADTDFVCIYAVMHEKRRPDYWRTRLPGV
jgi:mRNA-degrading endonuclease RelE of RelBE toxin-antitoxin system